MLSVLIPTYDEPIIALCQALSEQAGTLDVDVEILVNDQCTEGKHTLKNQSANALDKVRYTNWNKKPGRAANRNYLASCAQGDWLLFLDSDTTVHQTDFLRRFWEARVSGGVTCGRMEYLSTPPERRYLLRWKYGRARESRPAAERNKKPFQSFISFAFLIEAGQFERLDFDESIVEYGHEDTLFGKRLKNNLTPVIHTDISLLHTGLATAEEFLEDTRAAARNLELLHQAGKIDEDIKLYSIQQRLSKIYGDILLGGIYRMFGGVMEAQLKSRHPSLFIYDLYKLSYFCSMRRGRKIDPRKPLS